MAGSLLSGCDAPTVADGVGLAPASGGSELRVCLGEADLPRSTRAGGGFDFEIAGRIASKLNKRLVAVWLPRPIQNEIESTDLDFDPLSSGQCDLQMSIPGDTAIGDLALRLSNPYYGTQFELIPSGSSLSGKVAVRSNTVAHVVIDAMGVDWTMQPNTAAIVAAVESSAADVGLLWGPDLALVDMEHERSFEAPKVLRWNQHIALRQGDDTLAEQVNSSLAAIIDDVPVILRRYRVPSHGPFDGVHTVADLRAL